MALKGMCVGYGRDAEEAAERSARQLPAGMNDIDRWGRAFPASASQNRPDPAGQLHALVGPPGCTKSLQ